MGSLGLNRQQALMLGLALLAVLALVGPRLARTGTAHGPAEAGAPSPLKAMPAARPRLVVDVVGAVRHPGLYRLREGARVADAVARAGGPTRKAELGAVNLAAPLVDGTQVVVPMRAAAGAGAASSAPSGSPAGPAAKVSLGSATLEQLDALPGIGPVTAQKIIDWRVAHGGFRSVDALDDVPGIGPARIAQLRDLVTP
jgi:competence protein ComEA